MDNTSQPTRNIRDSIKSFIPNWLANRLALQVAFKVIYIIALMCDLAVEAMLEGFRAPMPGLGTPTALPYIGQTRGLIRGLTETDASYIARLLKWLDLWEQAGSAETLVQLVQVFLGNNLVVRLVDRSGNFVTANANGTTTFTTDGNWDWDDAIVERFTWWGDLWLIVYDTDGRYPTYSNLSDPTWIAQWGTYQNFGTGHEVTRNVVDGIYAITGSFKSPHTWLSAIVWCTDPLYFIPHSLSGTPDGNFGNWGRDIGDVTSPARLTQTVGGTIRYWTPQFGG